MPIKSVAVAHSHEQGKKVKFGFYLAIMVIVMAFAFILNKNIALPQTIMRPIGVTVLSLLFFSAFTKPFIPYLVLVLYSPFSKALVGDFDTYATAFNLTNILMFISLIALVVQSASIREKRQKVPTLSFAIFAFILWGILSLIGGSFTYGSSYAENFIVPLKRWLTPILLYFFTVSFVKDKPKFKRVLIVMMIVTAIVGIMASRDYLDVKDSGSLDKSRVGSIFGDPNTLSGFFVYNMFLFLGFFFTYFPRVRYFLFIIPFLICFRGIQVTFSRGAYIAFAFGAIATAFFKSKIIFALCLFALIFAILNPVFLPAGIRERMESTFYSDKVITTDLEEVKDKSAANRILIWKGAIEMIKERPVFGVGYGLFPYFIPNYASIGYMDAHNTYLILAAEMGIPALMIFALILFLMIKNSFWLYRKVKDKFVRATALGILGGLFGLLAVNMFGSRLNSEEVSSYFWIYAGLIMVAVRLKKAKKII